MRIPKRTLARRKRQARLAANESDRIFRLARVAATAVDILGDRSKAFLWLQKPNRALGNATPLSLMDTDPGARHAEAVLMRIAYGIVS